MNVSPLQRDRELSIILISDESAYVVATALFSIILLENIISQFYIQTESFILNIAFLMVTVNSAVS